MPGECDLDRVGHAVWAVVYWTGKLTQPRTALIAIAAALSVCCRTEVKLFLKDADGVMWDADGVMWVYSREGAQHYRLDEYGEPIDDGAHDERPTLQ